jgi:hypothetical protein
MARLRFRISMSLDGFTAGPEQSTHYPLGSGGEQLHRWAFRRQSGGRPTGSFCDKQAQLYQSVRRPW